MKKTAGYLLIALLFFSACKKDKEMSPVPSDLLIENSMKREGNEYPSSAILEGTHVLFASTFSNAAFSSSDMAFGKISAAGTFSYAAGLGLTGTKNEGYRLIRDPDGAYLIIGAGGDLNRDGLAVFTNADGQYVKSFTSGTGQDDYFTDGLRLPDGSWLFAGTTNGMGNGLRDIYLVKMSSGGSKIWEKTFGTAGNDGSSNLFSLGSGFGIYGYTDGAGAGDRDLLLLALDQNGDSLWSRTYGGSKYEQSGSMLATTDGNFILCGHSSSFGDDRHDAYVLKVDASGTILWQRTYGSGEHEGADAILRLSNGDYALTGYSQLHEASDDQLYYLQINASGQLKRQLRFGGSRNQRGSAIAEVADGILLIGFTAGDLLQNSDLYLVKIRK
jgi:hypothetical protein